MQYREDKINVDSHYLVVWRKLHCRYTVDVLFDLVEEVIPTTNQTAFVLIVNQVQLIGVPYFTYL